MMASYPPIIPPATDAAADIAVGVEQSQQDFVTSTSTKYTASSLPSNPSSSSAAPKSTTAEAAAAAALLLFPPALSPEYVKLLGNNFTPLKYDDRLGHRTRIGVPGHVQYEYTFGRLFQLRGSAIPLVFLSPMVYFQFGILLVVHFTLAYFYSPRVMSVIITHHQISDLNSICVFALVFAISNVFAIRKDRFENTCKTNGNISRINALVTGAGFHHDIAYTLLRYANSIITIYYLLLSGPLDDTKWNILLRRGLLTSHEIELLQRQGAPAIILYSWSIRIISQHNATMGGNSTTLVDDINHYQYHHPNGHQHRSQTADSMMIMRALEESLYELRGFSAKQIAFAKTQIPYIYFHTLLLCVNVYLALNSFLSAQTFAYAMNADCETFLETWRDDLKAAPVVPSPLAWEQVCIPAACTTMVVQIIFVIIFCAVLQLVLSLCDFASDELHSYDFGFDLDNLWNESQEAWKSMLNAPGAPPICRPQYTMTGNTVTSSTTQSTTVEGTATTPPPLTSQHDEDISSNTGSTLFRQQNTYTTTSNTMGGKKYNKSKKSIRMSIRGRLGRRWK